MRRKDKMGAVILESVAAGLKSGEGLFKFRRIEVIKRVALCLLVLLAANGSNGSVVIKPVDEEETLSPRVDRAANGSNCSKVVPLPRPIDEAPAATFLPLRGVDGFSVHIIGFPESTTLVSACDIFGQFEMHKGKFKLKDKLVGVRHVRSTTGNSRGAKIVDCDEADEAEPSGKIHRRSPRSAETNEAWETLKKSSKELRASVKDPLPDAIHNGLRQDKRQEVAENNSITIHNGYFGSSITCSSPFLTLILPRSAETNEAWEALKKSSKELRASVRIPFLMQSTTV
ncbi:hypothetical protein SASPL_155370 [Salvia splendens]|uniref:Uncharacterized protein n=1 Tax=Salvia splendens TaxID=180675 RepID=A0A8X8W1N9_SALSN|nr:hypothetical protein SASPL_155370 [Salvia splendens]